MSSDFRKLLIRPGHDSFADSPWVLKLVKYTSDALQTKRVRVVGVCFGHQIVARALGVEVGRNADGWEAAVNEVQLSQRGQELFGLENLVGLISMLENKANCVKRIHQMHRDIARSYPEGIEPLGSSPVCSVQGMYSPAHLITVQGHPEFTADIVREIIETRHSTGIFNDEAYNLHVKKVDLPHDGVAVSRAFIRFLLQS